MYACWWKQEYNIYSLNFLAQIQASIYVQHSFFYIKIGKYTTIKYDKRIAEIFMWYVFVCLCLSMTTSGSTLVMVVCGAPMFCCGYTLWLFNTSIFHHSVSTCDKCTVGGHNRVITLSTLSNFQVVQQVKNPFKWGLILFMIFREKKL